MFKKLGVVCIAALISGAALADAVPDTEGSAPLPPQRAPAPAPAPRPAPPVSTYTPPPSTTTTTTTYTSMTTDTWDSRPYIAPMFAYAFPTEDAVRVGPGWAVAIGKPVTRHFDVEIEAIHRWLDVDSNPHSSLMMTAAGVNGLWLPGESRMFRPYLLAGVGANHVGSDMPPGKPRETDAYVTGGAGFMLSPWSWGGAIRAGAQWLQPINSDLYDKGETVATLGLQIPL
jgi:hypothetical protein